MKQTQRKHRRKVERVRRKQARRQKLWRAIERMPDTAEEALRRSHARRAEERALRVVHPCRQGPNLRDPLLWYTAWVLGLLLWWGPLLLLVAHLAAGLPLHAGAALSVIGWSIGLRTVAAIADGSERP